MKTLPDRLTRRGIAEEFNSLTAVAWEKLFEREDQNGIAKLRVPGDMNNKVYYNVEGIVQWLVRNDYYTRREMESKLGLSPAPQLSIRQHLMVG
jgi:hypothetical protein